jgi:hypothetical protein
MFKRKHPPLPPRRQIELARPDLSAKEGLKVVQSALREADLDLVPIGLTLAGAADLAGRLRLGTGAWQVLFWWEERSVAVQTWIFFNGNFGAEYVVKPIWERVPSPIQEPWVDSTVAAKAVSKEPVVPGVNAQDVLFLSLVDKSRRRFWEVVRSAYDVETTTARTHTFLLGIERADVLAEHFKLTKGATTVDSWQRVREG